MIARPDLAFLSKRALVPIAGLVLIDSQPEYREKDSHQRANRALRKLAADRGAAVVNIDTRLDVNTTGLFTCAQIESLIARMDVVLTNASAWDCVGDQERSACACNRLCRRGRQDSATGRRDQVALCIAR